MIPSCVGFPPINLSFKCSKGFPLPQWHPRARQCLGSSWERTSRPGHLVCPPQRPRKGAMGRTPLGEGWSSCADWDRESSQHRGTWSCPEESERWVSWGMRNISSQSCHSHMNVWKSLCQNELIVDARSNQSKWQYPDNTGTIQLDNQIFSYSHYYTICLKIWTFAGFYYI